MCANVSLNLSNEFDKFNNTVARMLDYHTTLRLHVLLKLFSGVRLYNFAIMYATLLWSA